MSLLQQFISNYHTKNLFNAKDRLLIAVSGGIDSVVLCKLCSLAELSFSIAHCNFQLRGADSDRDEAFVKEYARQLGAVCHAIRFNTKEFAAENKLSIQEAARELRYKWFEQLRTENNYNYILTAHHADDNIETLLISLFRGTGIKGLTGIREKNGKVIRPLLFARRKELEDFLHKQQLQYVQDETNLHDDYTRNYFRNTLLPSIAKIFPEVNENLLANISRMKDAEILYRQSLELHKKKLLTLYGDEVHIPVLLLQKTPAMQTVLYEIIKEYGYSAAQVPEVVSLLQSESGKYVASQTHRIFRNRKHLIISLLKEIPTSQMIIENAGKYVFANGTIVLKIAAAKDITIAADTNVAYLDASKIKYPLILRPWKTGDYFYPLGMQKKKKLSRFFIDKKLSLTEKEKVWVIEMDKKIIWVVGHRIDDRFKVTNSTDHICIISIIPSCDLKPC